MRLLKFFLLLTFFCIAYSAQSIGKKYDGLYVSSVIVKNKTDQEWRRAVKDAFDEVLVKVSGNPGVNTLSSIKDEMLTHKQIVQQFSYENAAGKDGESVLSLKVNFDIEMVNDILKKSGQMIWGDIRPETMVWFLNDSDSSNVVITDQDDESRIFKDVATKWGVNLYFPITDIKYNSLANLDIDSNDVTRLVKEFSARYNVEQILIGQHDRRFSDKFNWKLVTVDDEYSWSYDNTSFNESISNAIGHMVKDMVSRNAVFQEDYLESVTTVSFSNVSSLSSYQSLLNFLKSSPIVSEFYVDKVQDNYVSFSIISKGGSVALSDYFQKNKNKFALIADPDAYETVEMAYSWLE
ncbi:MAG: DUF2066 domain-containing protein [Pseudomonadota bacterium]|nr:DUF2066 domain-containing protein [Pseudomonadota bacterium]